jgi:hypothetical protein
MNIFYIIGVIVVVLFVAGFFGLHAWTKYLAEPASSWIQVAAFEFKPGERERCTDRIGENDRQIVFQNTVDNSTACVGWEYHRHFQRQTECGILRHRSLKLRQIQGQRRREHSKNIGSVLHWKAADLVGTAQQVFSHNPLEILVLALDAVPGAPVRPYRQECEYCIDMAWLNNITALRSSKLMEDIVIDMVDVFHRVPRL